MAERVLGAALRRPHLVRVRLQVLECLPRGGDHRVDLLRIPFRRRQRVQRLDHRVLEIGATFASTNCFSLVPRLERPTGGLEPTVRGELYRADAPDELRLRRSFRLTRVVIVAARGQRRSSTPATRMLALVRVIIERLSSPLR